jgi:predicted glutamine amidotransferase
MCIIVVSKKGVAQPSLDQLRQCFRSNPHGAGYMVTRDNKVEIHKGFMTWNDFHTAIRMEGFTDRDPVVYHFRISTQAGISPEMTHPFPLTSDLSMCEKLDLKCSVGLAHNGVIRMVPWDPRYSDTALFVTDYMTKLIRKRADITDPAVNEMIRRLTDSRWAILASTGEIVTVGHFIEDNGILFSNSTYTNDCKWRISV